MVSAPFKPRPWTVIYAADDVAIVGSKEAGPLIAHVFGAGNGRLITEAPAMYEVIRALVYEPVGHVTQKTTELAFAILDRIEGG